MDYHTDAGNNKDEEYFETEDEKLDTAEREDKEDNTIEGVIPSSKHENKKPGTSSSKNPATSSSKNSVPGESGKPSVTTTVTGGSGASGTSVTTTAGNSGDTSLPSWNFSGEVELPEDNF